MGESGLVWLLSLLLLCAGASQRPWLGGVGGGALVLLGARSKVTFCTLSGVPATTETGVILREKKEQAAEGQR